MTNYAVVLVIHIAFNLHLWWHMESGCHHLPQYDWMHVKALLSDTVWYYFGKCCGRSHCQHASRWLYPQNIINPLNIWNSFRFRPWWIVCMVMPQCWCILASSILPAGMVEFESVTLNVMGKVDQIIEFA